MALKDITHRDVERALKEFDRLGIDAMLKKYGGGPSTHWYVLHKGECYDQKLILRAAHELADLGPLPPGRGTFTAAEARRWLDKLGFDVVDDIPAGSEQTTPYLGRWHKVGDLIGTLYHIVDRLEVLFPRRKFTPDGHLVGSIGEALAEHMFGLDLLPGSSAGHDAVATDGRKVQIKLTQGKRGVALRSLPDHLLVLRLTRERSVEVIYNGKGCSPWSRAGNMQKNGQCPISLKHLRAIDDCVPDEDRLPLINAVDLTRVMINDPQTHQD